MLIKHKLWLCWIPLAIIWFIRTFFIAVRPYPWESSRNQNYVSYDHSEYHIYTCPGSLVLPKRKCLKINLTKSGVFKTMESLFPIQWTLQILPNLKHKGHSIDCITHIWSYNQFQVPSQWYPPFLRHRLVWRVFSWRQARHNDASQLQKVTQSVFYYVIRRYIPGKSPRYYAE